MRRRGSAVVVVVALLLLAGCAGTHRLREAQDAFDRGARAESGAIPSSLDAEGGILAEQAAVADYSRALALVDEAIGKHGEQLESDGLTGTARVLRALALWRLADLDGGPGYSKRLDEEVGELAGEARLGPRDRALVAALPGLRDHDLGLAAADLDQAERRFESAYATLDRAAAGAGGPERRIILWLRLAQLRSCRAWQAALYAALPTAEARERARAPRSRFRDTLATLKPAIGRDPALAAAVAALARDIGVSIPE